MTNVISNNDLDVLTTETVGGLKVEPVTEATKFINILIYGESGVGKTVLAGSASEVPELSPVLFLNLEGGTLSLRRRFPKVKAVRVNTWLQLQAVYDDILAGKTEYKTVVLDSLSEFQKLSMDMIMTATVLKAEGIITPAARWGMNVDDDRNIFVPAQREWGINLGQMRMMVRAFRDAGINVIFTAGAKQDLDKRTGMWMNKPMLQGQSGNELPGFIDEVYFYYNKRQGEDVKRLLLTAKTDTTIAKSRGDLPVVVEDPTMQKLYDLIMGDN